MATMTKKQFESLTPYERGFTVFFYGSRPNQPHVPDESNPYDSGTTEHREWDEGQMAAQQILSGPA